MTINSPQRKQIAVDDFERWYRTPLGRRVATEERQLLEGYLPGLFGYSLLQIGGLPLFDGYHSSPISQKIVIGEQGGLVALPEALPIQSDSVDLVILPHAIELSYDPHQLLREAERVLIPEGHLIILGFNPWSLWGLRHLLLSRTDEQPWSLRFHSLGKLSDWLSLLGFEQLHSRYHLYQLPFHHSALSESMSSISRRYFPRLGGGYCLLVRKRVSTLTPIRGVWGHRKRVVGLGLNGSAIRRE